VAQQVVGSRQEDGGTLQRSGDDRDDAMPDVGRQGRPDWYESLMKALAGKELLGVLLVLNEVVQ
jgi:hypothetical protein